jgi:hypothetical protein
VADGEGQGAPARPLVEQEAAAEVGRGEERVREEAGEGRDGGEAEEVERRSPSA